MIASFDIGIKNMAFCVFDASGSQIIDWNVLDLLDSAPSSCTFLVKDKPCNKKAKYSNPTQTECYCLVHSKKSGFLIPTKESSPSYIKKQKKENLVALVKSLMLPIALNKDDLIKTLNNFYESKNLHVIKKQTAASSVDLITIGKKIKEKIDNVESLQNVSKVLIENQISKIASRMKTIQGMLAQYFIMKNENTHIEFVSSSNKLKSFVIQEENLNNYKQHKKDAVYFCDEIIKKQHTNWIHFFHNHKKKDDLADCFLQGIYCIHKK